MRSVVGVLSLDPLAASVKAWNHNYIRIRVDMQFVDGIIGSIVFGERSISV